MTKKENLECTSVDQEETQTAHLDYVRNEQSFHELAAYSEQENKDELMHLVREQLSDSARVVEEHVYGHGHFPLLDIQWHLVDIYYEDLRDALAENDFSAFSAATAAAKATSLRVSRAIQENTGFVDIPGYTGPPVVPNDLWKPSTKSQLDTLKRPRPP